jgi:hypothetical protein
MFGTPLKKMTKKILKNLNKTKFDYFKGFNFKLNLKLYKK